MDGGPMQKFVRLISILLLLALFALTAGAQRSEQQRWQQRARSVTITRDDWGIAHVHGKTDADAVFGMIYAQAEDDFNRVETNYINSMGRLAEADGQSAIWRDLRMKLFIDPQTMKAEYERTAPWLQKLMNAWADGLNFYLAKHPEVKPRVIGHFEPWMALTFSEGSIGGDIETINLSNLEFFYGQGPTRKSAASNEQPEGLTGPGGSNGIAISPTNTIGKHALLLINPHTSFYFRSELQMTSDEGLNAYGAVTWGQFFVYQGFNEHCGWMHTSNYTDIADTYIEKIKQLDKKWVYEYDNDQKPVTQKKIVLYYLKDGKKESKTVNAFYTGHGPVM